MMAAASADLPLEHLKRSIIDATFVLLYDQDAVTKAHAATMAVTDTDGATVIGVEAAEDVLVRALSSRPADLAAWLSEPGQVKISLSLALATTNEVRERLSAAADTAPVLAVLRAIDRREAVDRSLSETGKHQAIVIDLTEAEKTETRV